MKKKQSAAVTRRSFLSSSAKAGAASAIAMSGFPSIVPASVFGKQAPSNIIQVGQIGIGRIARVHDLPSTMQYDDVRVVAAADFDGVRLDAGKKYIEDYYSQKKQTSVNVSTFDNYRDLINDKNIDAVLISTPDHWHAQVAVEAALAGKHIYCQKPTSLTIEEGRQMSDFIRKAGVVFQLGSQQRSLDPWPQFKKACELVRNGRIGELKTVKIGLPGDPPGGKTEEMPLPQRFNYDAWLGSTPYIYYTFDRVHSQTDVNARPGWLRMEQFGAGMITGWGVHHIDIAHWGMGMEYGGPTEATCVGVEFPRSGLWNVHGDFEVQMTYPRNITMIINPKFPNGIRFEGSKGWIFCTRSGGGATSSDPAANARNTGIEASDPSILTSVIGANETHLYASPEQHRNWLDAIKTKKPNISPIEVAHRSCSACLVAHVAMKFPNQRLQWDAAKEKFTNHAEANKLLSRPQRYPYGTSYIKQPALKK